jgi:hypothetical protein
MGTNKACSSLWNVTTLEITMRYAETNQPCIQSSTMKTELKILAGRKLCAVMLIWSVREKKVFNFFIRAGRECLLNVRSFLSSGRNFEPHVLSAYRWVSGFYYGELSKTRGPKVNESTKANLYKHCSHGQGSYRTRKTFLCFKLCCL